MKSRLAAVCALALLAGCGDVPTTVSYERPPTAPALSAWSPGLGPPVAFGLAVDALELWQATETWNRALQIQASEAARAPVSPPKRPRTSSPPTPAPKPPAANPPSSGLVPDLICQVFGSACSKAIAVARCESGFNPAARNGQYRGIFQLSSYHNGKIAAAAAALSTPEHPVAADWSDPRVNVLAAYYLFSEQGWGPWECA